MSPDYLIAAEIENNIRGEHEALEGYYRFLRLLTEDGDIDEVKEIISDEMSHSAKLCKMLKKFSNIEPAKD